MLEPNTFLLVPDYFNLSQQMAIFFGNSNMNVAQAAQQVSASRRNWVGANLVEPNHGCRAAVGAADCHPLLIHAKIFHGKCGTFGNCKM